ncbi:hypothetical protein JCM11251_006644 [Rhodosporidiobolus azoricus]
MLPFPLVLLLSAALVAADRQISIENRCDYTIWPAVSGTLQNSGYTGEPPIRFLVGSVALLTLRPLQTGPRGWEAAPKSAPVVVTIPESWNGRVWPRRGCNFDANGAGSCLAGNCPAGRDCADDTMGWANLLEMNLNQPSGNILEDFWDISAVPGFVAPMSVTLSDSSCHAVTCSTDLNPNCPTPLRIMDGSNVIGCLSACMAGVNAGDNSPNCCSGSFLSHEACQPQMVDYYDYFKQGCPEAYAYPRDERANDPNAVKVVYTCPSASAPSYTVVFCPDAAGTVSNLKVSASNVTMTDKDDKASGGLSKAALIVLASVGGVLLLIAIWLFFLVAKLHKQEKAAKQHADEAQIALTSRSMGKKERKGYRDEGSEEERPVRQSRSKKSRA